MKKKHKENKINKIMDTFPYPQPKFDIVPNAWIKWRDKRRKVKKNVLEIEGAMFTNSAISGATDVGMTWFLR